MFKNLFGFFFISATLILIFMGLFALLDGDDVLGSTAVLGGMGMYGAGLLLVGLPVALLFTFKVDPLKGCFVSIGLAVIVACILFGVF